jgi:hypothetical protein
LGKKKRDFIYKGNRLMMVFFLFEFLLYRIFLKEILYRNTKGIIINCQQALNPPFLSILYNSFDPTKKPNIISNIREGTSFFSIIIHQHFMVDEIVAKKKDSKLKIPNKK